MLQLRKLAESLEKIFRWFDKERRLAYNALAKVIENTFYEKAIIEMIDEVLDDYGQVKDNASPELKDIRVNLYRKRNELRRMFEKIAYHVKTDVLKEIPEGYYYRIGNLVQVTHIFFRVGLSSDQEGYRARHYDFSLLFRKNVCG